MKKHIAFVHKNKDVIDYYTDMLVERGFEVTALSSGLQLLKDLHKLNMDLVFCSYELPNIDGVTLFNEICDEFPDIPVMLIGSTKNEDLLTSMLRYPNCEFMLEPIVPVELISRINALLLPENVDCDDNGSLSVLDLTLDRKTKRAYRDDREIILTPTEYRLLEYLMENSDQVLTRDMILNKVWSTTEDVSDRIVDVYIGYLRDKIDRSEKDTLIQTSTGFGYYVGGSKAI